jgi:hypothetical protein
MGKYCIGVRDKKKCEIRLRRPNLGAIPYPVILRASRNTAEATYFSDPIIQFYFSTPSESRNIHYFSLGIKSLSSGAVKFENRDSQILGHCS